MVFCSNCNYFKYDWRCENSINRKEVVDCKERTIYYDTRFHMFQNEKNNCQFYRRKWWKFWVNERGVDKNFNKDEFTDFCRSKHPEIVMEYMMLGEE